jgi:hypothetical protein
MADNKKEEFPFPALPKKGEELPDLGKEKKALYIPVKWKGILDTFKCETCGHCQEDEDGMILHVLKHIPEAEQGVVLNELLIAKEKNG